MLKDECLVVDALDNLLGTASKLACHQFNPSQPSGHLHRAFSVFLFDSQNRLLLQQRAKAKVCENSSDLFVDSILALSDSLQGFHSLRQDRFRL